MTYVEEQCGWEHGGECRGCHNRKRRDITRPSGVTEADGAGMRLNHPCRIWLSQRDVLSSFPRQREEVSGAGFAVCVLFYQIGPNSSSKHCGLGKGISAHSPAPSPWPKVRLVECEGANESLPERAGIGDRATHGDLPGSRQTLEGQIMRIPKQRPQPCQVHTEPCLKELPYAFCFACASPSATQNLSALAEKQVPVP